MRWQIHRQFNIFAIVLIIKRIKMFGDIMGMMGKLKETQQKIEETKKRLDTVLIDEQSSDGLLKVTLTANRVIKSVTVDDSLLEDKEQLEDYLVLVLNKAIAKATDVNEAELAAVAQDGMPNIPGLDLFK
jgi:DNA-binding YbaB/EbfC family protein